MRPPLAVVPLAPCHAKTGAEGEMQGSRFNRHNERGGVTSGFDRDRFRIGRAPTDFREATPQVPEETVHRQAPGSLAPSVVEVGCSSKRRLGC
jgi:hypothetical protein